MAGTTGFPLLHIFHGHSLATAIGEGLGVTITTRVGGGVEVMTEVADNGATVVLEGQIGRFVAHMTLVTITGSCEGCFAIMAAATGFPFNHISHSGFA